MEDPLKNKNKYLAFQQGQEGTPIRTEEDKKIMKSAQLGYDGVSFDYKNSFAIAMYCMAVLGEKGFGHLIDKKNGETEETIKKYVWEDLQKFKSYEEYSKQEKNPTIYFSFLTTEGKKIIKELDEIVKKIKEIAKLKPAEINFQELKDLLLKGSNLINNQEANY